MTLEELVEWIKQSKYVTCNKSEHDESGNYYEQSIYENNGKLYSIEFLNGYPYEIWEGGKKIKGYFRPQEVVKEEVVVTKYRII